MNPPLVEALLQAVIIATSITALAMLTAGGHWPRWGVAIGFAGQPAWIWSTFTHGQFGMFIVSLAFALVYGWGIWRHWIAPLLDQPEV
ncbi:MAG: hypothetical protein Q8M53_10830 [Burkholderiales bacterium]|nr:hypothetical protein [Burkholderiales bacterium]